MANCTGCPLQKDCDNKENCTFVNNPANKVKSVVGIMSGKGGVGKSTVSALLAKELNRRGYKVGILDADMTGPSIPRLLHIGAQKIENSENGINPAISADGIKVMSLNLLLENEEQPVIWRGPLLASAVKQFWQDVNWGELDYLLVDMPPGTGDVALTAMQSIPINGIVMVSVPQDLVSMIVAKAVNMVRKMNISVIGVIENMSYIICPNCQEEIRIFADGNDKQFLHEQNLILLGEIPMNTSIAGLSGKKNEKIDQEIEEKIVVITDSILDRML